MTSKNVTNFVTAPAFSKVRAENPAPAVRCAPALRRTIHLTVLFWSCIILAIPALPAFGRADVIVLDRVTSVGRPVFITVNTRKWFFPAGGKAVEVRIGNNPKITILSGADGYGYYKYVPRQAGLKKISATAGEDQSSGWLLVMAPKESVLLIGVDGGLRRSPLSTAPLPHSRDTLVGLPKRFRIVYLTQLMPVTYVREWLAEKGFPQSVVLHWQGPEAYDDLQRKGVRVAAVVGSAALVKTVSQEVKQRYTFEDTNDGTIVTDWREIARRLGGERG